MQVFDLTKEQEFNPHKHVEKILGVVGGGDVTVACWEPGQISRITATRTRPRSIFA
jgi:hypothetical protein